MRKLAVWFSKVRLGFDNGDVAGVDPENPVGTFLGIAANLALI